jgi:hypothetical protein
MSERLLPHTLAIDVLPLELMISETSLMAYGNVSESGMTGSRALSARAP